MANKKERLQTKNNIGKEKQKLLDEYDIQSAEEIHDALKDLF